MLTLAAEPAAQDAWLQIVLAAIPAVASITAAYFGAVQFLRRRRERNAENAASEESPETQIPASPSPLPTETPAQAAIDPITMMLIESLKSDLVREREIVAEYQRQRVADSGTIARLMAELSDAEARLLECLEQNRRHEIDKTELRRELQVLRDRLNRMTRFTPEGNH